MAAEANITSRVRRGLVSATWIVLTAAIGVALASQGWRTTPPAFDMLTYFFSARALIERGELPSYGDLSSYGSFSTPGTAWLMAPGMLMGVDLRLIEKVGGAALHLGTLVGIFVLARMALGDRVAFLAVLTYGLSSLGLSFAGSLWPIGHPFFYVWVAVFSGAWVVKNDPRYLAAALVTWAIGMFVDMAILPVALVLPALWLVYRPRIVAWPLTVALVIAVVIWLPYLTFQLPRGFSDLRSQMLRQSIFPENYREAWCDPGLMFHRWQEPTVEAPSSPPEPQPAASRLNTLITVLVTRAEVIAAGLVANFECSGLSMPLSSGLMLATLAGVCMLGVRAWGRDHGSSDTRPGARRSDHALWAGSLAITTLVPWLALLLVAEPERPERFLWLWSLQAIALVALVVYSTSQLRRPALELAGQILLVAVVVAVPLLGMAETWRREGWAGAEAPEVLLVDYVAEQIRDEGRSSAAIGYQIFIYPFMANYHIISPTYKVGSEIDLLFQFRHGIANTNSCAEGVADDDEFRIVRTTPMAEEWAPREYFDVGLPADFQLERSFGPYAVYRRAAGPSGQDVGATR